MWKKNILLLMIVFFLFLLQVSFFAPSEFWQINFQLVFLFLLILLLISNQSLFFTLNWAIIAGLLLDLFSQFMFGTYIITFCISLTAVYLIFKKFLTNRSYYSLTLLVLIGTIIFNLILFITTNFFLAVNLTTFNITFNFQFITYILWQSLINIIVAIIAFKIKKSVDKTIIS